MQIHMFCSLTNLITILTNETVQQVHQPMPFEFLNSFVLSFSILLIHSTHAGLFHSKLICQKMLYWLRNLTKTTIISIDFNEGFGRERENKLPREIHLFWMPFNFEFFLITSCSFINIDVQLKRRFDQSNKICPLNHTIPLKWSNFNSTLKEEKNRCTTDH